MNKFDVIIIGSGLGGLLCGYILSKEGFNVCILEKNTKPGGNLQTFSRQGKKFETGVHYIGALRPGQTLARYWEYFGLMDVLQLQQLDQDGFDRIAFGDKEFPLAQGFENFIGRLLQHFPGDSSALNEYISKIQEVVSAFPLYNLELPGDHREQQYTDQSASDFYEKLSCSANTASGIPLSSVLAGNNYLYGGSRLSPLYVASLINHSFISGAYRIIGGSDQIAKSLTEAIKSQGGTVITRHEVTAIEELKQKFTIKTGNRELFLSSMVISAIHPATTLAMMPADMVRPAYQKRIVSLQNTDASFILYLSVKPQTFPYLNYNYYYHSSPDPWDESTATDTQWPKMFLLSTGCHMPDQKFTETVTVLTYMRYDEVARWMNSSVGKRGEDYLDFKNARAQKLIDLVSQKFPGLPAAIEHMEISTPLTYRDYTGIPEGSLYGIQKNYHDPQLTAVMPKTKIPNFYFTGQNTNMHGVLGVTIGSVVTCGEILGLEYLLKKIQHG
ncbi:MAG: NAD(P)/FAD-dependent oxidoreductase [Bacteroidales bacterium]|nr:NAD(P)/FAD-dependent oxidoreductase [Bacteroidales bacterium]